MRKHTVYIGSLRSDSKCFCFGFFFGWLVFWSDALNKVCFGVTSVGGPTLILVRRLSIGHWESQLHQASVPPCFRVD